MLNLQREGNTTTTRCSTVIGNMVNVARPAQMYVQYIHTNRLYVLFALLNTASSRQ